jgi:hypothetical protein
LRLDFFRALGFGFRLGFRSLARASFLAFEHVSQFIHRQVELVRYDLTQPRAIDVGGHRHRLFNSDTALETASWLQGDTVAFLGLGKTCFRFCGYHSFKSANFFEGFQGWLMGRQELGELLAA